MFDLVFLRDERVRAGDPQVDDSDLCGSLPVTLSIREHRLRCLQHERRHGVALGGRGDLVSQSRDGRFVDIAEFFDLQRQRVEYGLCRRAGGARAFLERLVFRKPDEAGDDPEARLWIGVEELGRRALLEQE